MATLFWMHKEIFIHFKCQNAKTKMKIKKTSLYRSYNHIICTIFTFINWYHHFIGQVHFLNKLQAAKKFRAYTHDRSIIYVHFGLTFWIYVKYMKKSFAFQLLFFFMIRLIYIMQYLLISPFNDWNTWFYENHKFFATKTC